MADKKLKKVSLAKEVKAAIVLSLMAIFLFGGIMIFSNTGEGDVTVVNPSDDDTIVNPSNPSTPVEEENKLIKPFNVNAKVERYYFDTTDNQETQELSILEYKGKFTPATAMEFSYNNAKFDVVAVFDGVVTERKVDPLYGYMLYIKNDNGLTAIYGSLNDISVNVGDNVKQGDVIAKAGTNTIDATLNNHLHFALMKDSKLINPNKYFGTLLKNVA